MTEQKSDIWNAIKEAEATRSLPVMRRAYESGLRVSRDLPALWLKLGQIGLIEGSYREPLAVTIEAADAMRRSSRWQALPHVCRQLLRFDERHIVRRLIGNSDWNNPAILRESPTLAQQLWLAGAHQLSLDFLDHAIARLPPHHLLHFSRGEALIHLGQIAAAQEEYERALAIQPAFAHPHRALAYHCPDSNPGSRLGRLFSASASAKAEGRREDAIDLDYALFKELDYAGRYEDAWLKLESGARARKLGQGHNQHGDEAGIAALISTVKDPVRNSASAGTASNVFIVGLPRSGTTVLERMLGNHPNVHSAGELNAFSRAMSWEMDRFYEPPIRKLTVEAAQTMDASIVASRYSQATEGMRQGRACLIDKNPINLYNVGYIARAMPDARILCLLRDPMDVCYSNFKELFASGSYTYSYDLKDLADHFASFKCLADHWEQAYPHNFRTVSYAEVIDKPELSLAAAMRFCGLQYQGGEEDLVRNCSPVSTASRAQVRRPLNRDGIGAWQRYEQQLEPLRRQLELHGLA